MLKKLHLALMSVCLLTGSPSSTAQPSESEPVFTAEQLQQDFRFLRAEIDRIHPEPGLFASRETLRKAYGRVEEQFHRSLTRDQAWRVLATLNPVFADAHMFVTHPDWKALTSAHLDAGGVLFPYEVQVDATGTMHIRTELGGAASALAGRRIEAINGVPASRVAAELLAGMAGDTPALRANLLSRRMWFYYWKTFGAPPRFDLTVAKPGGSINMRVPGSNKLPDWPQTTGPAGFEKTFAFELLPGDAALLTINQFLWSDPTAFYAFTKDAFAKIRAAKVKTLMIDVRENTGGNDDLWKLGVLPYLADKPYRNASSYVKKVIAGRASGTEQVGDVVHGFVDTWTEPDPASPLHFSGKTYVLVGRITFSSAVLFSNVVQDFGIGKLVGAGGYARSRQSGGVVNVSLPNTRLEISIPRFVVDRPSGEREPVLVHPDIVLPDSPYDRMTTVNALLERVRRGL